MYTLFNVCIEKNEAINFILHLCSAMLLIYSNYHHNVFTCTNSVFCKKQRIRNQFWFQHCSQVFAHFFFIQFLLHFPFFFLFSHFLVGWMSTQGAAVVVVVPAFVSLHSHAIDWKKYIPMFLFRLWNWLFWPWIMYKQQVARWKIFMEQELRFGLDLGQPS